MDINDCEIARILVDTGSNVDLIFLSTLRKVGIENIQGSPGLSHGFTEQWIMTLGIVSLLILVPCKSKEIEFLLVDSPYVYNAILGTHGYVRWGQL